MASSIPHALYEIGAKMQNICKLDATRLAILSDFSICRRQMKRQSDLEREILIFKQLKYHFDYKFVVVISVAARKFAICRFTVKKCQV